MVRLNLCSGTLTIPGFDNIDIELHSGVVRQDLRDGIPYPDGAVELINISQGIEHFTLGEVRSLLKECFRVLEPWGEIRLATPDLRLLAKRYLAGDMDVFASVQPAVYGSVKSQGLKFSLLALGNQSADCTRDHYTGHQTLFDEVGLAELLQEAGFVGPRRVPYDAAFDASVGENHSFAMVAQKPGPI